MGKADERFVKAGKLKLTATGKGALIIRKLKMVLIRCSAELTICAICSAHPGNPEAIATQKFKSPIFFTISLSCFLGASGVSLALGCDWQGLGRHG